MEHNREQLIEKLMQNDSCYAKDIKAINEAIALIRYDEEKIKELTEENERLHASCTELTRVQEENERLMEELEKACKVNFYCSFTKSKIQNCPIDDEVAKAKADTVRKMQEALEQRIHSKLSYHGWYLKETVIAEIAKELLNDAGE